MFDAYFDQGILFRAVICTITLNSCFDAEFLFLFLPVHSSFPFHS
jgi:hypothetical protein